MAKKKEEQLVDNTKYIEQNLEDVMRGSMLPYSEHVIMDRAIPRVEDGLKPVQRRILYSMMDMGVTPDKPYRKSARIVGDCMGKYHPTAIRPYTARWSSWRSLSPCRPRLWTGTAISARWTATARRR